MLVDLLLEVENRYFQFYAQILAKVLHCLSLGRYRHVLNVLVRAARPIARVPNPSSHQLVSRGQVNPPMGITQNGFGCTSYSTLVRIEACPRRLPVRLKHHKNLGRNSECVDKTLVPQPVFWVSLQGTSSVQCRKRTREVAIVLQIYDVHDSV